MQIIGVIMVSKINYKNVAKKYDKNIKFLKMNGFDDNHIRILGNIIFKASAFDEMNVGVEAFSKATGESLGKFRSKMDCSRFLQISAMDVNRYLAKTRASRNYEFAYCPYYTYEDYLKGENYVNESESEM